VRLLRVSTHPARRALPKAKMNQPSTKFPVLLLLLVHKNGLKRTVPSGIISDGITRFKTNVTPDVFEPPSAASTNRLLSTAIPSYHLLKPEPLISETGERTFEIPEFGQALVDTVANTCYLGDR
jgi:hypothetical protein